jgi:hypothetical protein
MFYPDARPRLRPLLSEEMLGLHLVWPHDLQDALVHKALGQRIGEYLVTRGRLEWRN